MLYLFTNKFERKLNVLDCEGVYYKGLFGSENSFKIESDINDAKGQIAPEQTIGRTCHGDVDLVIEAKKEGASYAAMGAIFASTTKPNADVISRQELIDGCQQGIDICVIGGLSAENIVELAGLPIAYVAVVGDIMDLPVQKIAMRCQQWQQALDTWYAPAR